MIKCYKYRLYPNKTQIKLINNQLFEASKLYNTALEQRINAYRSARKYLSYYDQSKELKELREEGLCNIANFTACQGVLRKLDKTYKAFYNRIKQKQKVGFPRFKPASRYNTLTYPSYGDGCKLKDKKVYLQGIGNINIRFHRPIEGTIKTISITRKNGKYFVSFACAILIVVLTKTNKSIGIDMGIESFAITSNAEFIKNPRYYASAQKRLRVLQRSISRKMKGSNNRKNAVHLLANQYEKTTDKRKDFLHKLSDHIIKENDIICIEDLNIKGLTVGILAKSVHDVAWGIFFNMLSYKAENAGRELIRVNPNGTSQRCSQCGTVVKKDLSVRWHDCPVCGLSVHRDINSAKEILKLGTDFCKSTWGNSLCVLQETV